MLLHDLKYAVRLLLRDPVTSLACILTLTIGIGANTAVFSVLRQVILSPLPFPDFGRLVSVPQINLRNGRRTRTSLPDLQTYEKEVRGISSLAAFRVSSLSLSGGDSPEQISGSLATQSFFTTLGVPAITGRTFSSTDPDGTVVLSYSLWRRRFRGDLGVIGKQIILDGQQGVVVGVMPAGFWFPEKKCELWRLITSDYSLVKNNENYHFLYPFGRLRTDATVQQVHAQLDVVNRQLAQLHPDMNSNLGITVVPLREDLVSNARPFLLTIMAAVVFVLLIACVNVANLQLARLLQRNKNLAIRIALGASWRRLARQLLVENLLLSILGGVLGTGLAAIGTKLLLDLNPDAIPRPVESIIDGQILWFTLAVSLATGLLFGLLPIVQILSPNLIRTLSSSGRGPTMSRGNRFAQGTLVVIEVAIALVLLVSLNLITSSFLRMASVDPGHVTKGLLTVRLRLQKPNYPDQSSFESFQRQIYGRLSEIHGVQGVAASSDVPLVSGFDNFFSIKGEPTPPVAERVMVGQASVSPGYFRTMGIALHSGREFSEMDGPQKERVAIINESMARRYWPGRNPIGSQIRHGLSDEPTQWCTIIGVVGDTRRLITDQLDPKLYTPFLQIPQDYDDILARPVTLVIRTASEDASTITPEVRRVIQSIDPNLAIETRAMDEIIYDSVAAPRFRTGTMGVFGAIALLLGIIGIYGVVSGSTIRETREIGVRMALGATPSRVLLLILRRGMTMAGIGVGCGIILALIFVRSLRSFLFEISPTNPVAFLTAALVLIVASLAAIYFPARRAAKVDPVVALRNE